MLPLHRCAAHFWLYIHPPSEGETIAFSNRLDLYRKSPDSGELQYTSRIGTRRFDRTVRAGGGNATRVILHWTASPQEHGTMSAV